MIELNHQQTHRVSAGILSNLELELNDQQMQYLKTRSLVGLVSGVVLGLNLTPGYFILTSMAGFACGFSVGAIEAWAKTYSYTLA